MSEYEDYVSLEETYKNLAAMPDEPEEIVTTTAITLEEVSDTSTAAATFAPTVTADKAAEFPATVDPPAFRPSTSGLTFAIVALWMPLVAVVAAGTIYIWRACKKRRTETTSATRQPRPEV